MTYDPRNVGTDLPAAIPLVMFDKQVELVNWILDHIDSKTGGMVEKTRDMGATVVCCSLSIWLWLYRDGVSIGWGSRKEMLVDRLGDPDSIFEKMRGIMRYLPRFFWPEGFDFDKHATYMRIINPVTGSTITGESGTNIGRGGRKTLYFKDESAHYDQAESIEAALGDNTNTPIDISSVNGAGNVFHRRRSSGVVDIFVMDWRDHPAKTQQWYNDRKKHYEVQGLSHLFAQEVDRDYTAAVKGIFIPSTWIKASIDAHLVLDIDEPVGIRQLGFDVADEGLDKKAIAVCHGNWLLDLDEWSDGDADMATKRVNIYASTHNIDLVVYDPIGVGSTAKATFKRLGGESPLTFKLSPFNAGGGVDNPKAKYMGDKINKDLFANIKAQKWWDIRQAFYKTWKMVRGEEVYNRDELAVLPSSVHYLDKLVTELSTPLMDYDAVGRIMVESKKKLAARGVASTNLADAYIMSRRSKAKSMVNVG